MQKDGAFKIRWKKKRVKRVLALDPLWIPAPGERAMPVLDGDAARKINNKLNRHPEKVEIETSATVLVTNPKWLVGRKDGARSVELSRREIIQSTTKTFEDHSRPFLEALKRINQVRDIGWRNGNPPTAESKGSGVEASNGIIEFVPLPMLGSILVTVPLDDLSEFYATCAAQGAEFIEFSDERAGVDSPRKAHEVQDEVEFSKRLEAAIKNGLAKLKGDVAPTSDQLVGIGFIETGLKQDLPSIAGRSVSFAFFNNKGRIQKHKAFDDYGGSSCPNHGSLVVARASSVPCLPANCKIVVAAALINGEATAEQFIAALAWLLEQEDIKVINMSLQWYQAEFLESEHAFANFVRYAEEGGVTLVAASGNYGHANRMGKYHTLAYPAAYAGVISAGAVDGQGKVWPRTGHGTSDAFNPNYLAPGVVSASSAVQGTSFAAPIVSAISAIAISNGLAPKALLDDISEPIAVGKGRNGGTSRVIAPA